MRTSCTGSIRRGRWQTGRILAILLAMAWLPVAALAQDAPPEDPGGDRLLITAGFLTGHPDLKYRLLGMDRFKDGKHEDAMKFFRRAAFYADKPSQGMVAEMLWNGHGGEQDRAAAYAWMDLAAERGYVGFLGLRERYWSALTEQERERALAVGQEIYARYGDAAARPRLSATMRRERRNLTGSRTGFAGNVQIYVPGPSGYEQIDGSKFYDDRYWDPDKYLAWHDSIWMKPRIGRVDVGEIEQVRQEEAGAIGSRVPTVAPEVDAEEPEVPEVHDGEIGTTPPEP